MELLVYGHGGAKAIVFPTSQGRFFDWEDRGMIDALERHIDNGWVQLYCVDSVDRESWFNGGISCPDKARRHFQYQEHIINEVLPLAHGKNDTPFTIAMGASFGAYHTMSISLRYPDYFNRAIGMSGVYDIREWTGGYMDDVVAHGSPCEYMRGLQDHNHIEKIRNLELIIPIGKEDSLFGTNKWLSEELWAKGVWHAFREWDGYAHDWPQWKEMVQHYIGGADSKD